MAINQFMLSTRSSDRTIDLYVLCYKINKKGENGKKSSSIKIQTDWAYFSGLLCVFILSDIMHFLQLHHRLKPHWITVFSKKYVSRHLGTSDHILSNTGLQITGLTCWTVPLDRNIDESQSSLSGNRHLHDGDQWLQLKYRHLDQLSAQPQYIQRYSKHNFISGALMSMDQDPHPPPQSCGDASVKNFRPCLRSE